MEYSFGKSTDIREIEMARKLADILDQGPEYRELFLDEQDFRYDGERKVGLLIEAVFVGGNVPETRKCLFYSDASLLHIISGEPKVCENREERVQWLEEVLGSNWYQQAIGEVMLSRGVQDK